MEQNPAVVGEMVPATIYIVNGLASTIQDLDR